MIKGFSSSDPATRKESPEFGQMSTVHPQVNEHVGSLSVTRQRVTCVPISKGDHGRP